MPLVVRPLPLRRSVGAASARGHRRFSTIALTKVPANNWQPIPPFPDTKGMKDMTRTLLLAFGLCTTFVIAACGSDAQPVEESIFAEMSEAEIFENVRILECNAITRCVPDYSEADCLADFSDDSAYQSPIEDSVRSALSSCVQSWQSMSCDEVLNTELLGGVCADLEDYLDLK